MIRIDSCIVNAIETYSKEKKIELKDLAKQLKVSPATLTKWRKIGNRITTNNWSTIFPVIREYLPQDRIFIDEAGKEQYSSNSQYVSDYFFDNKYVPAMIPQFELLQLLEYDDMLDSILQFANNKNIQMCEYRPKHKNLTNVFAVNLNNNNYAPLLPSSTKLYACTSEKPINDGLSIAKANNDDVMICRYKRNGDNVSIANISSNKNINFHINDAKKNIIWIFPILYYEVTTF